jgi:hypothetical protein
VAAIGHMQVGLSKPHGFLKKHLNVQKKRFRQKDFGEKFRFLLLIEYVFVLLLY